MAVLFLALLLSIEAKAHSLSGHENAREARINPPLEPKSDKKFFGPPFPADYPDDKRPVPDRSILNKLKGPDQPYPALQSKADFDRDYVKDENSDKGQWKAQMEYDTLRRKLAKEKDDERSASDRAGKEGHDADDAQRDADRAGKDAADAKKGVDDANADDKAGKDAAGKGEGEGAGGVGGPPSKEALEKLKKAVDAAEENYEKEKKQFEECKRQLEEAHKNVEELKAKQAEMEKQLSTDTKLWAETKTTRLSLQKSKEEAAHSKKLAAEARLKEAQAVKEEMDKIVADKKAVHEKALETVRAQKAHVDLARGDLEKATLTLQKLRGYKAPETVKSDACRFSFALALFASLAMSFF